MENTNNTESAFDLCSMFQDSMAEANLDKLNRVFMEEVGEFQQALWGKGGLDAKGLMKEGCDVLFTTVGLLLYYFEPYQIEEAFKRVAVSNLSKVPFEYDQAGKVVKGKNYIPPNLDFLDGLQAFYLNRKNY